MHGIILCEECDGFSRPPCSARSSDPMDIANGRCRKVIINDNIDPFEVDASSHQLCSDQDPDFCPSGNILQCYHAGWKKYKHNISKDKKNNSSWTLFCYFPKIEEKTTKITNASMKVVDYRSINPNSLSICYWTIKILQNPTTAFVVWGVRVKQHPCFDYITLY